MLRAKAASLSLVENPSYHRKIPLKKSYILVKAVQLALHLKISSRMLAEKKNGLDTCCSCL